MGILAAHRGLVANEAGSKIAVANETVLQARPLNRELASALRTGDDDYILLLERFPIPLPSQKKKDVRHWSIYSICSSFVELSSSRAEPFLVIVNLNHVN